MAKRSEVEKSTKRTNTVPQTKAKRRGGGEVTQPEPSRSGAEIEQIDKSNERAGTSTATEDAMRAGAAFEGAEAARERTKAEIEAGKKSGKYEVLTEGMIFGDKNKKHKMGETVTMTADEADAHRKAGVALAGPQK